MFFEFGSGVGRASFGIIPPLNVWHYICATADGTTVRVYINGTLYNSGAQNSGGITTSPVLCIGSFCTRGGVGNIDCFFRGLISHVSMRALSSDEIMQSFESKKSQFDLYYKRSRYLLLSASNSDSYPGFGSSWFDLSIFKDDIFIANGVQYSFLNSGFFCF
jgi:hypothetical protein